jgi:hypothetical protein
MAFAKSEARDGSFVSVFITLPSSCELAHAKQVVDSFHASMSSRARYLGTSVAKVAQQLERPDDTALRIDHSIWLPPTFQRREIKPSFPSVGVGNHLFIYAVHRLAALLLGRLFEALPLSAHLRSLAIAETVPSTHATGTASTAARRLLPTTSAATSAARADYSTTYSTEIAADSELLRYGAAFCVKEEGTPDSASASGHDDVILPAKGIAMDSAYMPAIPLRALLNLQASSAKRV